MVVESLINFALTILPAAPVTPASNNRKRIIAATLRRILYFLPNIPDKSELKINKF